MKQKLHVEIIGEGETTFVISCGLSQTTANWRAFARSRSGVQWILFDPRGQGRSELGTRPYRLEDHTEDCLRVIERNASGAVHLLGFSHGGRVAMNVAVSYPERVQTLTLVSTAVHATPLRHVLIRSWYELLKLGGTRALAWGAIPSIIGPGILKGFKNNPELLVKGMETRNTDEGLLAMLEGMQDYPPALEDAKRLTCPVLFLRGEKDPLLDEGDDQLIKAHTPHAIVRTFPRCGHTLALEKPDTFWETVQAFVAESIGENLY